MIPQARESLCDAELIPHAPMCGQKIVRDWKERSQFAFDVNVVEDVGFTKGQVTWVEQRMAQPFGTEYDERRTRR
jgi:hypothetical protein